MDFTHRNASEREFQNKFVKELTKYRWQAPDELNGVTVQDLIDNWRRELNRINADSLEGEDLTDTEFDQVMSKVKQISNSYEAAKLLSIEGSTGKIDGIYRDENLNVTKKQITLTIFKKAQVGGGDSSYQIAREVQSDNKNRFDIVLLINGLPLINIELKRSDKSLDEAFGQFKRYYRDGEYSNNFMAFSQMMIVMTDIETRYFATPKSINDFNPAFVFNWSVTKKRQEDGKQMGQRILTDYREVIEHFLMVPMAHQMVGEYLIIDEDPDNEENRRHLLMRPYQVYALQAIEQAALGWDNKEKIPHGGFVWHTTGSGKTITSFKTAQFLSTRTEFDKVVFLLDRRDLDEQTSKAFKAYASYTSVAVDDTKSTYQLRKQLSSPKSGIVVTTTFKLSFLVKELLGAQDNSLASRKIVFIVDEAHRTTMGDMMVQIKDYFRTNGLFFGFTGTPLFEENGVKGKINNRSELINTTEKLFGPLLHQYTIDEAISDGNVLGFHVDYINTGEFSNYEDLREVLLACLIEKHSDDDKKKLEKQVYQWSEFDLEYNARKEKLLVYQDETHIPRVVESILGGWWEQSQQGEFNAILTVAEKKRVIAYYAEFEKQILNMIQKGERTPNVAMTFSFGNENTFEDVDYDVIEKMFDDYESITGIKFSAGDRVRGEAAYFEDLTERIKRGGSGRNSKNIDIVIVADQLLTGYDAKRINTLYVDRHLELQGLIQAYSRTNRVFGSSKEFGTIINFQYPRMTEAIVDEALYLYGSGGSSSAVLVEKYEDAVASLRGTVEEMVARFPNPTQWVAIQHDKDKKAEFKGLFRTVAQQMNRVKQYYEFEWDVERFGFDEHQLSQYMGAYRNLFPREVNDDDGVVRELVGRTKLQGHQVIDAEYLFYLIGKSAIEEDGVHVLDPKTQILIFEQIQAFSDLGNAELADSLRMFVTEELLTGRLPISVDIETAYRYWRESKRLGVIEAFATEWGIDKDLLKKSLEQYNSRKADVIPFREDIVATLDPQKATNEFEGNRLEFNLKLINSILPNWMKEMTQQYK